MLKALAVYAEDYPWDVRVEKLLNGLKRLDYEPHLLCRNTRNSQPEELVGDILCHRLCVPYGTSLPGKILSTPAPFNPVWKHRLVQLASYIVPDIMLVRDVPLSRLTIQVAKNRKIPIVVDMAENHPAMWANVVRNDTYPIRSWVIKNPGIARRLEKFAIENADAILVVVEEMAEHLVRRGCKRDKIYIVSNTPILGTSNSLGRERKFDDSSLRLVYVGNITRSRGLIDVIEAIAICKQSGLSVQFDVIGAGPGLDELIQAVARLGLDHEIRFAGWVDNVKVPTLLERCDIGIIPHRKTEHTDTTIPNKIFDYMAAGLPVIVSNAAPMMRIVHEVGCGAHFDSGNPNSLSQVLAGFTDKQICQRMGTAGRKAIEDRYNWSLDLQKFDLCLNALRSSVK